MHPIVHAATRTQIRTCTYVHIYTRCKEREVFIAEGSLSLAQFYYRNNVKAASFEAARSEIALTSKTAYFCSSCVPRAHVCVARAHVWEASSADADLICAFHAMDQEIGFTRIENLERNS